MKSSLSFRALLAGLIFILASSGQSFSLERVRFATVVRAPSYDMPQLAAQEKGLWQEQGLEVEWLSMKGPGATFQALVAGALDMGMSDAASAILAASRGVPLLIVADLRTFDFWHIWVRGDGSIKEPKELKGTRISAMRMPSAPGAYARILIRAAGLTEKDVKFVQLESGQERIAALRAGVIDAYVGATLSEMPLKVRGVIRSLINMEPYLPKEWPMHIIFARKEFIAQQPEAIKRAVRAFLKATDLVQMDQKWTIEKLISYSKYSPEAARETVKLMKYGKDGRINAQALANVQNFLVEHGIMPKEKALPAERLYSRDFTD